IRRAAENLELLIGPRTLLPLRLIVTHGRTLLLSLVGRRHQSSHGFVSGLLAFSSYRFASQHRVCQRLLATRHWPLTTAFLAGPLGFEPRQSAPKALDLPLVDGPVSHC